MGWIQEMQIFFAGSLLWPWLLFLCEMGVLFSFIRLEKGLAATLSLVVSIVLFKVLFNISVLQYMVDNWFSMIEYIVAYLSSRSATRSCDSIALAQNGGASMWLKLTPVKRNSCGRISLGRSTTKRTFCSG
jgi:hypothetical protein